ncbi:MAG: TetR/AcrR family transcriptional regulator [Deltaproteobacteria bacterium]|nr:TetR/AcrR family transcriptional regulator [Deltaproteobacteria bacterium]
MPRPRFQKLSPSRREQILETAAKEFAHHGFDGASLNHILGAAGLSKGAAYYYFDDKADLFTAVVQHYFFEHLANDAGLKIDALDAASYWPTFAELYRQAILHMREDPWMSGLARAVWKLPHEARRQDGPLASLYAFGRTWLEGLLARGQQLGVVRTDLPTDLVIAMLMALDEATDHWFGEHFDALGSERTEELVRRLMEALRDMLLPRPEARS